ncbi:MAG: glutamine-hydrolyzing carbamoyl-phosphate synthase small subunit [Candidatus Kapaibacterium sp.]
MINSRPTAKLVLENGLVFTGRGFGATDREALGEVVFNTSITGYQEILTDPSYFGQIVTFTYPHQGNVGVNNFDVESKGVQAAGMIVRELSRIRSNWRSEENLEVYLRKHGVLGIEGIDTRMLVRTLREEGAMRGIISAIEPNEQVLLERARAIPSMKGADLTSYVTTAESYQWEPRDKSGYLLSTNSFTPEQEFHVAVLDYGVKHNILERLSSFGCRLTVLPGSTPPEDILALNPDGIFISNGPGDPDAVTYAVENLKVLLGKKPIFGICLGHQLLALALGGETYKLKFGHRGANHPVQQVATGANEITSQNHGFAVDLDSMKDLPVELTHVNLNDNTVEGFRHREMPLFCVQYHPEASPGPHDADYLFRQFIEMMEQERENRPLTVREEEGITLK